MKTYTCELGASGKAVASLLLLSSALLCHPSHAQTSEIQKATDEAAMEAKRDLCVVLYELHRPRPAVPKEQLESDLPQLKEKFFAFYDGKRIAARYLSPATFSKGQVGPLRPFTVAQITGPKEMHVTIDYDRFILTGMATADLADGQNFRSSEYWHVRETETYTTAINTTKTVYVLEPAGDKVPRVQPTRIYPWYDTKNKVLVVGEFKALEGNEAIFSSDGTQATYPLSKLAHGDRDLIRLLSERNKPSASAEKPAPIPRPVSLE